jgi:transposase
MVRQQDQRKLAEWRQRLQRFEKSGLTVARFCARERVSVPTFWYWRRKQDGAAAASRATPAMFSPVEVVGGRSVSLRLPSGAVLEIPEDRPDLVRVAIEAVAGISQPC